MSLHPLVPWWLLAVLVIPPGAVCLWQAATADATTAGRLAWLRRTAVVAVVAVMGLGPSVPVPAGEQPVRTIDVFFVVDRTGSMAAEDYNGGSPRLEGVRHDLVAVTRALPGARYSVISFDSQASRQLPLTFDARAIESWAETYAQETTAYSRGSLTDRPLGELRTALDGAAALHPENVRVVFFMSDGEQTARGEPQSFAALAPLVDAGAVMGYGTASGGRMKVNSPWQDESGYILDPTTGADAVSRLDEATLTALADQLGVRYVARERPTNVADLVHGIEGDIVDATGAQASSAVRAVLWPLALVLLALLGAEAWRWAWTTRQSRGIRR